MEKDLHEKQPDEFRKTDQRKSNSGSIREAMTEVKVNKLLDLQDPLWGFENLHSLNEREKLRELINKIKIEEYVPTYGKKYELESSTQQFDHVLFESDPLQSLMKNFDDINFIQFIGNLLYQSNTNIIDHLEYHDILNESNKYTFIEDLASQKYKIQPNLGIGRNLGFNQWRKATFFNKEQLKKLILSEKFIPYYPTLTISRIDHGGFIAPHTDMSEKIASFMIYLPENKEESDSSLGTTFWKPKPLNSNRAYVQDIATANQHLTGEKFKEFIKKYYPIRTKFQNKYTLLFFRSNTSWHSFEYNKKDFGPRLSINVNFMFPMTK